MNIDQNLLDKQIMNILRKKVGDLFAENIRQEAIQQMLLNRVAELENELANAKADLSKTKPTSKKNDGGSF